MDDEPKLLDEFDHIDIQLRYVMMINL